MLGKRPRLKLAERYANIHWKLIHNNLVGPSCDTRPPLSPRRVTERKIHERTGAGSTYAATRC